MCKNEEINWCYLSADTECLSKTKLVDLDF